jgi:hypothetical protein
MEEDPARGTFAARDETQSMRLRGRYILFAACLAVALSAGAVDAQVRARRPATGHAQRLSAALVQGLKYSADWSLDKADKIREFFVKKFGHDLPVSAMGQTETHDRLGFDHHDAMDVALNPDSREGRTLIGYLRQMKIPFIAFRRRVEGSATGPHIHIGNPSQHLDIAQAAAGEPPQTMVVVLPDPVVPPAKE